MSIVLVATLVQATTTMVTTPSSTPVLLMANGSGNTELCSGVGRREPGVTVCIKRRAKHCSSIA